MAAVFQRKKNRVGLVKRAPEKKSSWPVAYRWLAMGTVVIYTAVGSQTVNVAYASDLGSPANTGVALAAVKTLPARRFDIPAGPMDTVLASFQTAASVRVKFSEQGIGNVPSPGVSGMFTVEQALQKLLAETGLSYRFTNAATVIVELKTVATTVDVTALASPIAASLPKYSQPLADTPQSISVVPRDVLNQQGNTTLRDALRNVSGISLAAGEGGAQGDNLTIRGFTARNDLFIDGMRDFGSYYRDPFNTEEIEVLQGPSSVTFGRGSTGGVVNQATKTPHQNHSISGDVDLGTDLTRRITLDVNTPVPALGSGTAFRLNVMGDLNNIAGRDVAENRRFGVAPSLALGLGTPTRVTLSYFHQTGDDIPDYGIPWLFNGPAPVNRENYYGFQNGNYLRTYDDIGTARVEHDITSNISIRNQARYANYVRDARITEGAINSPSLATPLDQLQVTRKQIAVDSAETFLDDQLDLTARFKTGFIGHSFVTGVEGGRETSDPTRPTYTGVATTSLVNPTPDDAFTGVAIPGTKVKTSAVSASVYALDTMRLSQKWEVTGGIRWDRFDANYKQLLGTPSAFSRVDAKPTWRAALTYKPVQSGSIYFAAGTSFNPSAETLSLSAANANLPPENNRTFETGAKWELAGGKLSVRGALFRTEKQNAREPDPNNPLLNVLAGTQRVDGTQIEVQGHVTRRWDILSSYAYLDSRVMSSNAYPKAIGAQLANVPRNSFNVWTNYRLPSHFDVGAGGNFVDSRTASSTVPLDPITGLVREVPSYWVFNAMASHPLGEHASLQANVYNLANRYYYDQLHPAHIVPGAGRSALIGIKFKF